LPERRKSPRVDTSPPPPSAEWAYFFDIDGTLADIAAKPSGVRIEREILHLIYELHAGTGGAMALISGRSIEDVDRLFGGSGLPVAGQHGLERRTAKGEIVRRPSEEKLLLHVREELSRRAMRDDRLLLEFKGLCVAMHYRAAPEREEFVKDLMASVALQLGDGYVLQPGKMVVELKPAGKDKGVAVREFLDEKPFLGRTPVFVGDDLTDEVGFTVVNAMSGHSVKVGGGPTAARWRLRRVASVREWLKTGVDSASFPAHIRAVAGKSR
jgi:trehalose 6-phosphate phosphatase